MKLSNFLVILLLSLIAFPSFAVGTSLKNNTVHSNSTILITSQENEIGIFTRVARKYQSAKVWLSHKLASSGLLDNPRKLLIYALIAFVAALAITLLGSIISLAFLSLISWLLYLASFAFVVLWVYAIFIRRQ